MKREEIVKEILRLNKKITESILLREEVKVNKYKRMLNNVLKIYFKYDGKFEE